jgi:hypothetical protein
MVTSINVSLGYTVYPKDTFILVIVYEHNRNALLEYKDPIWYLKKLYAEQHKV